MDRLPPKATVDLGSIPLTGSAREEYIACNKAICGRLHEIGIECENVPGVTGFLPGIQIQNGVVLVDIEVALPASLLHEAAHIALMAPCRRREAGDDIDAIYARMRADARAAGWGRQDPRYGAMVVAGEDRAAYALAWAWAKAWSVPPGMATFSRGSYGLSLGELRASLEDGSFAGVRFLEVAQLVAPGTFPRLEKMAQDIDPQHRSEPCDSVNSKPSVLKSALAGIGSRLMAAVA